MMKNNKIKQNKLIMLLVLAAATPQAQGLQTE